MGLPTEWFVYWAVAAADVEAAVEALRAWHGHLQAEHPSLRTARYVRPDPRADRPDRHTVMETYAMDGSPSSEALLSWAAPLRVEGDAVTAPWRLGARHVETFQRLP